MINAIIFDLCGPLVTIDVRLINTRFWKYGVLNADPYMDLVRSGVVEQADAGRISNEEFFDHVRRVLNTPLTDWQISDAWNALVTGYRHDMLRMAERAHSMGLKTFVLSNSDRINAAWFNDCLKKEMGTDFLARAFTDIYYSCNLGLRKPSAEIFNKVLELNNLTPDEVLFIDDTQRHCAGAESVGIHSLFFRK